MIAKPGCCDFPFWFSAKNLQGGDLDLLYSRSLLLPFVSLYKPLSPPLFGPREKGWTFGEKGARGVVTIEVSSGSWLGNSHDCIVGKEKRQWRWYWVSWIIHWWVISYIMPLLIQWLLKFMLGTLVYIHRCMNFVWVHQNDVNLLNIFFS